MIEFRNVRGHVEVFIDGRFFGAFDNELEAHKELDDS